MVWEAGDGADGVHDGGNAGGKRRERGRRGGHGDQVDFAAVQVHLRKKITTLADEVRLTH